MVPLVLLAFLVGALWLRAAAVRQGEPEPVATGGDASAGTSGTAEEIAPPAPVAVVRDAHALGRAIMGGTRDSVIEVDHDGVLDLAPFSVAGRRLALRAAAGRAPVLRVASGDDGVAIRVADGALSLSGMAVHAADAPKSPSGRRCLFWISGGTITCEDVILRMSPRHSTGLAAESVACIQVGDLGGSEGPGPTAINFRGVRLEGDAAVVAMESPRGGRVDMTWDTGVAVTRRLVTAEGSRTGESMIAMRLSNVVASCIDGLVSLRDAPGLPRVPRLMMQATGCRFIVTDPSRALIEQTGIADPDAYASAVSWLDGHGRYEGTRIFQRIDGAAERIETVFGDPSVPFVHDPQVGVIPDPSGWEDQAE